MLDSRLHSVLWAVVDSYIANPDPVGSRFVSKKYAFNLSSATIRNIMADLEDMGFLHQPHTSAGRIPTDKAYRLYVDTLLQTISLTHATLMTSLNNSKTSKTTSMNSSRKAQGLFPDCPITSALPCPRNLTGRYSEGLVSSGTKRGR